MDLLIKNGRVIDPAQGIDEVMDIACAKGTIEKVAKKIKPQGNPRIIDASNKIVCPGFIDSHCHLREPGREDEETIKTGATSAAAGGYTTIMAMPNTDPCLDTGPMVAFVFNKGRETSISVFPIGAITKNRAGKELTEMADLVENGAVAFSDDGNCVADNRVMRRALEYAKMVDRPLIDHPEEPALARNGVMNEGKVSTLLGLPGIPEESEEIAVFRDITLASLTENRIHLAHLTSAGSVALLRQAKKKGVPVTAEVTVHHLLLTDESVRGYNTNTKVSPPLRTKNDLKSLKEGIKDGIIEVIVTDHAPHSREEKETDFENAAFGIIGFETALPLLLRLTDDIPLSLLIACLTSNPARIFRFTDRGSLKKGLRADITIFDPKEEWTLTEAAIKSRSKNTPFLGEKMQGRVCYTICNGKVVSG
ncbi:MAG: dihydroorotase [Candidatus Omnitrophica bacterium]|nr:dihydroorotase [Candidatus Omnitrophota bacterium]